MNLTLASSMTMNIVVKIWIPFPLLLPPAVYTYQHSLHYPMPSPLVLNSHSHCLLPIYLVRPILNQFIASHPVLSLLPSRYCVCFFFICGAPRVIFIPSILTSIDEYMSLYRRNF